MNVFLIRKYSVKGTVYGPGEAEVDEQTHAALARKGAFSHPLADYPALMKAGYTSLEEVLSMDDSVLLKIDGIGPATIRKLRGAEDEPEPKKPRFIGESNAAKENGADKDQA